MRSKHGTDSPSLSEETKRNIYFYHHSIEDHIESLAEQAGSKDLVAPITAEVVRLLEAKALWETFRSTESLPEMWTQRDGNRPRGRPRGAARAVEANLSGNAFGTRPLKRGMSAEGRKAISDAQRERWAKVNAKKNGDRRGSPEAKAKQQKAMQKHYNDPVWRKKMLKRVAAMRARRKGMKPHKMSLEQRAKISAARKAYWAAKKAHAA